MLLAIDIGNSSIVFGLFQKEKLIAHWRVRSEQNRTTDEYWVLVNEFIRMNQLDAGAIRHVIVSCVVPPLIPVFEELSRNYLSTKPLFIGPGVKTGISILYKNPEEVGADRVVNAVAGFEKYGGPLIIVDFGTATTFDAVSAAGEYLGGAIFPGVEISLEALFKRTAKLPRVDLVVPDRVIGRSTVESIQCGTVYGFLGMIDNIVAKMREELGGECRVIGTGGLLKVIADQAKSLDTIDPFLTLDGLRIIHEKNRPSGQEGE
ncbi:MAG: type III pantothenate kinase [Nitrospinae bacterium]|nr:type III pantothenate kinase [Nitrospinota bacterium]